MHLNSTDKRNLDQTWVVIVLIVISILVTLSEVFLRFGLLHASQGTTPASIIARAMGRSSPSPSPSPGWSYPNIPAGCICPSLAPTGGPDMGVSGLMGGL